jgi:hypothetical protein
LKNSKIQIKAGGASDSCRLWNHRTPNEEKTDGADPRPNKKIKKKEGNAVWCSSRNSGVFFAFPLFGVWLRGGGKELKRDNIR